MSKTVERAQKRFQAFLNQTQEIGYPAKPGAKILDFGCGAGGFILQAALNGFDSHGVEVAKERLAEYRQICPKDHLNRFSLYDRNILPCDANAFDYVYSWFVFEHVPDPGLSLREIVRVTRPSGLIDIYADDARNCWDGHVSIPWPPFLPRQFARSYLEAFNLESRYEYIANHVVYITAPIVSDILTALGCEILYCSREPSHRIASCVNTFCANDDEAFRLGKTLRDMFERGDLSPPLENLHVIAIKRK